MDTAGLVHMASPLPEIVAVIAFFAVTFLAIMFFLEKTTMGEKVQRWIGLTDDELEEKIEDQYTNFTIHRNNYISGPR